MVGKSLTSSDVSFLILHEDNNHTPSFLSELGEDPMRQCRSGKLYRAGHMSGVSMVGKLSIVVAQ